LILESTDALRRELYAYLARILPVSAYELVRATVDEISKGSSTGKLTLGLIIAFWSASAGIDSVRSALNAVYGLKETRFYGKIKLQSLGLTILLGLLIGLVLVFFFIGWRLVQVGSGYVGFQITSPLVLVSIQWIAVILVLLFACELIYNLLPNFKVHRWIWITPGSIVAIFVWIALISGFRLYLVYFDSYNRTYGSLGAVIILMFWLYLTSVALLVGGLINSVLAERAKQKRVAGQ
jgi:membrane protein